jgi:hypothetical protein
MNDTNNIDELFAAGEMITDKSSAQELVRGFDYIELINAGEIIDIIDIVDTCIQFPIEKIIVIGHTQCGLIATSQAMARATTTNSPKFQERANWLLSTLEKRGVSLESFGEMSELDAIATGVHCMMAEIAAGLVERSQTRDKDDAYAQALAMDSGEIGERVSALANIEIKGLIHHWDQSLFTNVNQ